MTPAEFQNMEDLFHAVDATRKGFVEIDAYITAILSQETFLGSANGWPPNGAVAVPELTWEAVVDAMRAHAIISNPDEPPADYAAYLAEKPDVEKALA